MLAVKEKSPLLTEEDRELLQRWTCMQQEKQQRQQQQQQQSLHAPVKSTDSHVILSSSQQPRTVLSPKNLNLAANTPLSTSSVVPMTSQAHMVKPLGNNQACGNFQAANYENPSAAQVYIVQNYMPSSQTRPLAEPQLSQPAATQRPMCDNQTTNIAPNTQTLPSVSHITSSSSSENSNVQQTNFQPPFVSQSLATNVLPQASQSSDNSFLQMLYSNKSPPDYEQSVQQLKMDKSADRQQPEPVGASNSGISLSEFLPFQSYDPLNRFSAASSFGEQLTPDLSMFDSAPATKSPPPIGANAVTTHAPFTSSTSASVASPAPVDGVMTMENTSANSYVAAMPGSTVAEPSTSTDPCTSTATGRESNSQMLSIITQMKKSHVNDPLLLTLTPKTAGEPYGVGPDVMPDEFFSEDRFVSLSVKVLGMLLFRFVMFSKKKCRFFFLCYVYFVQIC